MNDFKGTVGKGIESIENAIKTIQTDIKGILRALPPNAVETESPIRLNDLGRTISTELNIKSWVQARTPSLTSGLKEKSPFEIQAFCYEYVNGPRFDPDSILRPGIQNAAYNHGLKIDQIKEVYAIELRDALLSITGQSPPD